MSTQVTVAEEIQELRRMTVPELVAKYEELHGKPPRSKNRSWLWKRCAWRLQEQRFGGLSSTAKKRLEELIAEIDLPIAHRGKTVAGPLPRSSRPGLPAVGTILTRQWRGNEVRVTVVEDGVEHEGVVYRSLSAVAKAITGSHCSGPAWFGLAKRKVAR